VLYDLHHVRAHIRQHALHAAQPIAHLRCIRVPPGVALRRHDAGFAQAHVGGLGVEPREARIVEGQARLRVPEIPTIDATSR
jgi:hypothetical protein